MRLLIKISGESLAETSGKSFDPTKLRHYVNEIADIYSEDVSVGIVIGGGNIYRGQNEECNIDRQTGDYMGMLATVINGLALASALEKHNITCKVMSALPIEGLIEKVNGKVALRYLEERYVVIFCGGTGNPYFTTDTAAALRAAEIKANLILKATRVDGIYDKDPEKDANAQRFTKLTFDEVYEKNLKVMDMTAFTICKENKIPIIVYNGEVSGNLKRILNGEEVGTRVSN